METVASALAPVLAELAVSAAQPSCSCRTRLNLEVV